jgi:hypothetical protein
MFFRQSLILDARRRPVKLFPRGPRRIALQNELEVILEMEVTHLAVFDGRKTMKPSHICLFLQALDVFGFKTNMLQDIAPVATACGRLR